MRNSNTYYVEPYLIYVNFIKLCKIKEYDKDLVLHKHHIIPKYTKSNDNTIVILSVEDHITAHLLLSKCFDKDTYEYISNLRASRILNKWSIKDKKILEEIRLSYCGINNPFYGKKHKQETKDIIAQKTSENFLNKSYADRYGANSEKEKDKRKKGVQLYWDNISLIEKEKRSSNISKSLIGNIPWNKGLSENDPRIKKMLIVYTLVSPNGEVKEIVGKKSLNKYIKTINCNIKKKYKINLQTLIKEKENKGYKIFFT